MRGTDNWKRGWTVVVASWMVHFSNFGTLYTFGVFFPYLLDAFGETKALAALVGSVSASAFFFLGFINGALVMKYGHRSMAQVGAVIVLGGLVASSFVTDLWQLFLTYGVVSGFGFGLSYMSAITIIALHFDRDRATATGLAVSGSGIGTVSLAPTFDALLSALGWRNTFRVQAALCTALILLASIFFFKRPQETDRQAPHQQQQHAEAKVATSLPASAEQKQEHLVPSSAADDGRQEVSAASASPARSGSVGGKQPVSVYQAVLSAFDWSLFRDSRFLMIWTGQFCGSFAYLGAISHWPTWGIENGLSSDRAALTVTAFGASSTVGRVIVGKLADTFGRIGTFWVGTLVMALDIAFLTIARRLWQLILFACLFGVSSGAFISLTPVVVAQLFGTHRLPGALGFLYMGIGIAGCGGAPFAGWVADRANYPVAFICVALVMAAGCSCIGALWVRTACIGQHRLFRNQTSTATLEEPSRGGAAAV